VDAVAMMSSVCEGVQRSAGVKEVGEGVECVNRLQAQREQTLIGQAG